MLAKWPRLDFVKIDIEDHEPVSWHVLRPVSIVSVSIKRVHVCAVDAVDLNFGTTHALERFCAVSQTLRNFGQQETADHVK